MITSNTENNIFYPSCYLLKWTIVWLVYEQIKNSFLPKPSFPDKSEAKGNVLKNPERRANSGAFSFATCINNNNPLFPFISTGKNKLVVQYNFLKLNNIYIQ